MDPGSSMATLPDSAPPEATSAAAARPTTRAEQSARRVMTGFDMVCLLDRCGSPTEWCKDEIAARSVPEGKWPEKRKRATAAGLGTACKSSTRPARCLDQGQSPIRSRTPGEGVAAGCQDGVAADAPAGGLKNERPASASPSKVSSSWTPLGSYTKSCQSDVPGTWNSRQSRPAARKRSRNSWNPCALIETWSIAPVPYGARPSSPSAG